MTKFLLAVLIYTGFYVSPVYAEETPEVPPRTFFRNGVFAPVYGDLGYSQGEVGGVSVLMDEAAIGIQVFKMWDVSLTGGYGGLGISGGPVSKSDAPDKFRAHYSGPVIEIHYVPDFWLGGSLEISPMTGVIIYEDPDRDSEFKRSFKSSMQQIKVHGLVEVYPDCYVNLAFGTRSFKTSDKDGADDDRLKTGSQSAAVFSLGFRGSLL